MTRFIFWPKIHVIELVTLKSNNLNRNCICVARMNIDCDLVKCCFGECDALLLYVKPLQKGNHVPLNIYGHSSIARV